MPKICVTPVAPCPIAAKGDQRAKPIARHLREPSVFGRRIGLQLWQFRHRHLPHQPGIPKRDPGCGPTGLLRCLAVISLFKQNLNIIAYRFVFR